MTAMSVHQRSDSTSLSRDVFRQIMGSLPTGITVVTTRSRSGRINGMTVNACTSVSLDPPQLLICLNNRSPNLRALEQTSVFAVNILDGSQDAIAQRFATPLPDKFAGVDYWEGVHGVPILSGALAYAVCVVVRLVEAGDHTIVIGRAVAGDSREGNPLIYFRRRYSMLPAPDG